MAAVKAGWRFQWRDAAEASRPKRPDIITVSLSGSLFLSRVTVQEERGFSVGPGNWGNDSSDVPSFRCKEAGLLLFI